MPDISSVFQRVGKSRYISLADCKAGYWQLPVREEDKWLTAFVCDAGLFEFKRAPLGLKGSGNSFVRALSNILRPIREFTDSFVDDIAVHSDEWKEHFVTFGRLAVSDSELGVDVIDFDECYCYLFTVLYCSLVLHAGPF